MYVVGGIYTQHKYPLDKEGVSNQRTDGREKGRERYIHISLTYMNTEYMVYKYYIHIP